MEVKVKKLSPNAIIPSYKIEGDAGCDITATDVEYNEKDDYFVYHSGLAFEVPQGYVLYGFPRSSVRNYTLHLTNSVGVIDSGYRGEVIFCYRNLSLSFQIKRLINKIFKNTFKIKFPYNIGDRIGQVIIMPFPTIKYVESDTLSETKRGENGLGSTGK